MTQEMTESKPWYRQPDETAKAFAAFVLYRGMMPRERSLAKVHHSDIKMSSRRWLAEWSRRHQWVARSLAHDEHLAAVKTESQEQAIIDMAERQAKEGLALQQKGLERLASIPIEEIKARDAISAVTEGAKLERMARGEPTEIVRGDHTIKAVREMTDEQLQEIIDRGRLEEGV